MDPWNGYVGMSFTFYEWLIFCWDSLHESIIYLGKYFIPNEINPKNNQKGLKIPWLKVDICQSCYDRAFTGNLVLIESCLKIDLKIVNDLSEEVFEYFGTCRT